MKDSLIVVSGGMDSITLLYECADRLALAVSFDYGANHNHKEIPFARIHCERLKIKHIVIPLAFMKEYFRSSLLDGSDSVPEGHYADENMKSTVVPFRNGIMLSVACGIAESNGLKQVLIANHGGDHAIGIFAPYTDISKTEIANRGKKLNLNYAETWSCYKGGEKHCGKCGTCVERKEALREAGIEDQTEYED